MDKLYLVTCNWNNDGQYEDSMGGDNEFVGLFDSYEKAKEAIMVLKEKSRKLFDNYYKDKEDENFDDWYAEHKIENVDRFQWIVPGYYELQLRYDIEEYEINSFNKYIHSDGMWNELVEEP